MQTITLSEEQLHGVSIKFSKGGMTIQAVCHVCLNPVHLQIRDEEFVPNRIYSKYCTGVLHNNPENSKFEISAKAISQKPDSPNWIDKIFGTIHAGVGKSFGL